MQNRKRHRITILLAIFLIGFFAACSDDEDPKQESDAGDVGEDVEDDADASPPPVATGPVELDFDEVFDEPQDGFVRAVQVEDEADLVDGEVAKGLVGDWLLENDQGRYLVGFGERDIGPCSWDGNVIEAEEVVDGVRGGSVLGEICFLINVGQTFEPQEVEIVEDGSDGRAIVAVTGEVAPLDFLNVATMVGDIAPGLYEGLAVDPDRTPPFTVTVYYVLTPESDSLRVLTAVRNDGEDQEFFNATHLVLSGSTGSFFNPLSDRKGWGFSSLGSDSLEADPVSFVGYFTRHGGYAVVPDPQEQIDAELPAGAGMVGISGVVGLIHGTTDLMYLLLANEAQLPIVDGYIGLAPGEADTVGYRLYPSSDGSVSTAADRIYGDLGVETTTLSGRIVDQNGQPVEGVQVTAVRDGDRSFSAGWTEGDGEFSMDVPRGGSWEIRAREDEVMTRFDGIDADGPEAALGDLSLQQAATVTVNVRTPQQEPVPARVVVQCVDDCSDQRFDSRERDSSFTPPGGWLRIVEVGLDGEETFQLAQGNYRISVNRGMTWSTWPQNATSNGGELVEVEAGDDVVLDAEIAEVVDTSGTLSADFHIHAMASPDSSVADELRVRDFLAGGLDVMVSSDHDAVVDFAPTIAALGAEDHITSVVGNEITSSTLGHINAFPLEVDENARRGGPLDWSGGGGTHMTLQEVSEALRQHPGEQVLQVNHPRFPGGYIGLMEADVLTGQSFVDPETLRMPTEFIDEETGDTGLWADDFDALEIYNGFNMSNFWGAFRWWLTMVGRGFAPTATAVSDTHGIYGSLGSSPRSFVFVDEGRDTPATMDLEHFVERVLDGALIGTSGPMMRVEVENDEGEIAGIGDVLPVDDDEVVARVTLEMPEWVDIDTLDVFMDVPAEDLQGEPGENVSTPVEPTQRITLEFGEEHRELVSEGEYDHYRLRKVVEIPLQVESDSYVVFMARGLNARPMLPIIANGTGPLAYSNPLFLDHGGDGWNDPPLRQARMQRMALSAEERFAEGRLQRMILAPGDEITPEKVGEVFEALQCDHGGLGDGHGHSHDHGHSHGHGHHHHHGHEH